MLCCVKRKIASKTWILNILLDFKIVRYILFSSWTPLSTWRVLVNFYAYPSVIYRPELNL